MWRRQEPNASLLYSFEWRWRVADAVQNGRQLLECLAEDFQGRRGQRQAHCIRDMAWGNREGGRGSHGYVVTGGGRDERIGAPRRRQRQPGVVRMDVACQTEPAEPLMRDLLPDGRVDPLGV